MAWCEANRVGYDVRPVTQLQPGGAALALAELAAAKRQHLASGAPCPGALAAISAIERSTAGAGGGEVVGKAEHNQDGANPRFVASPFAGTRSRYAARALYEDLYCARGQAEKPHRRAVRTVCRSGIVRHHAGQSAAHVVLRHGLCSGRQLAPRRPAPYSVRRCRRRDHPALAARARRSGLHPAACAHSLHFACNSHQAAVARTRSNFEMAYLYLRRAFNSSLSRSPGENQAISIPLRATATRPPGLVLREAERHRTRNPRTSKTTAPRPDRICPCVPQKKPPLPTSLTAP